MTNNLIQKLRDLVAGVAVPDEPSKPPIDIINPEVPDELCEIRYVRAGSFGGAVQGDRVRVAKSALVQPPIANILLTEAEHEELERRQARGMLALLTGERPPDRDRERADEALSRSRDDIAHRELVARGALPEDEVSRRAR